jgi:hypothetical protein
VHTDEVNTSCSNVFRPPVLMIITGKLKQTQQNASETHGELKGHPSVRIFMWFREYTVKTDV